MEDKTIKNEQKQEEDQDEGEEYEDETEKEDEEGEGDDAKGDEMDEDSDDEEEQQLKQPPRKMIKNINGKKRELPAENPPEVFCTSDNREWTFLQTFANYDKMQEFRQQNQCKCSGNKKRWQIRFPCYRRQRQNCGFMLLAKKTTNEEYHVYKYGEHNNHPFIKSKSN
jgi:hypothetical protein